MSARLYVVPAARLRGANQGERAMLHACLCAIHGALLDSELAPGVALTAAYAVLTNAHHSRRRGWVGAVHRMRSEIEDSLIIPGEARDRQHALWVLGQFGLINLGREI